MARQSPVEPDVHGNQVGSFTGTCIANILDMTPRDIRRQGDLWRKPVGDGQADPVNLLDIGVLQQRRHAWCAKGLDAVGGVRAERMGVTQREGRTDSIYIVIGNELRIKDTEKLNNIKRIK